MVNLFTPLKIMFLAISIPKAPIPKIITEAFDRLAIPSIPITPIYLDCLFVTLRSFFKKKLNFYFLIIF